MRRLSLLTAAVLICGGFAVTSIKPVQAAGPLGPTQVLPATESMEPLILTHSRKGKDRYWYYKKKRGGHVYRYDRKRHYYGRKHRHRYNDFGIYFGFNPYSYDPYFYDPYYYPTVRRHNLSCSAVKRILRRQGYRSVRAYDCRGSTYGFYVRKNNKNYKVVVRARNGHIISRVRR